MAQNSVIDFAIKASARLEANLKKLGPAVALKVGDKAVRRGAKVIVDQAKVNLRPHKKSGKLESSVTVRKEKSKFTSEYEVVAVMGFKQPHSRRAHLLEFGTKFARAFPFFTPAMDTMQVPALREVQAELRAGIKRETE